MIDDDSLHDQYHQGLKFGVTWVKIFSTLSVSLFTSASFQFLSP